MLFQMKQWTQFENLFLFFAGVYQASKRRREEKKSYFLRQMTFKFSFRSTLASSKFCDELGIIREMAVGRFWPFATIQLLAKTNICTKGNSKSTVEYFAKITTFLKHLKNWLYYS